MKNFLIVLAILGAAFYFPESRAVIMDVSSPVVDPIRGKLAEFHMSKISGALEVRERRGQGFPTDSRTFDRWVQREFPDSADRHDPWGNPYTFRIWPDSFAVVSAGPDGELDTDDDILLVGERTRARRR